MVTGKLCAAPEKDNHENPNEDYEEPNKIECNTIRTFKFPSSPHLNPAAGASSSTNPTRSSRKNSWSNTQLAFACLCPSNTAPPKPYDRLWNSSACGYADNKKDQAHHQEQEEQEFGNPCSRSGNTRKSKKRRHQCDDKKNQGPTQHAFTS